MEKHKDEPFFLNYWMFSVHAPFDAKPALIKKYRARANPNNPQRSPTYAAMVESMDDAVGTLLDALDRLGIADRTIIVFFSDNGGNMYNEIDGTTPTSNAPLRGGKATVYEGGIREPMVVIWPGVTPPGSRSDAVVQSCDFYPTILDMLALKPQPEQRFDGISIVPALKGLPLQREAIFTYFPHDPKVPDWLPPSVAVHQGDWKLIRIFYGGENGAHRWKLFNLRNDPSEQDDLAKQQPGRVKQMDALIDTFPDRHQGGRPSPQSRIRSCALSSRRRRQAAVATEGVAQIRRQSTCQGRERSKTPRLEGPQLRSVGEGGRCHAEGKEQLAISGCRGRHCWSGRGHIPRSLCRRRAGQGRVDSTRHPADSGEFGSVHPATK